MEIKINITERLIDEDRKEIKQLIERFCDENIIGYGELIDMTCELIREDESWRWEKILDTPPDLTDEELYNMSYNENLSLTSKLIVLQHKISPYNPLYGYVSHMLYTLSEAWCQLERNRQV